MTSKSKITTSLTKGKNNERGEKTFISKRHTETNNGCSDDEIEITIQKDGTVFFSGDGDGAFIYFYPEQRPHLEEVLAMQNPKWEKVLDEFLAFFASEFRDGAAAPLSGEEVILGAAIFSWLGKNFNKPSRKLP
jgi:hypothetical protein